MLSSLDVVKVLLKDGVVSKKELFSCRELVHCVEYLIKKKVITIDDYYVYQGIKDREIIKSILVELNNTLKPVGNKIKYIFSINFSNSEIESFKVPLYFEGDYTMSKISKEKNLRCVIESLKKLSLYKSDCIEDVMTMSYSKALDNAFARAEKEIYIFHSFECSIRISLKVDDDIIFDELVFSDIFNNYSRCKTSESSTAEIINSDDEYF